MRASCLLFACALAACKSEKPDKLKPPTELITRGDQAIDGRGLGLFGIDKAAAVDPRASALMAWVVPLERDGQTECSATLISAQALLTAAHCVDGDEPPAPRVPGRDASIAALGHRSCGHGEDGSCASPFPVRRYEYFHADVATVWLDEPAGGGEMPGLAHVRGGVPGAFVLSARDNRPHAVCRANAMGDVGEARGFVEVGDSGSSVVAFRHDGSPAILGVVSHVTETDDRWYFAMLTQPLPWPEAATHDRPPIPSLDPSDFAEIEDCAP